MKDELIFGRPFDDILAMQQGTYTNPVQHTESKATDSDFRLLDKYGIYGLKEKGCYGVLDRLGLL